ncbi:hypothetical protein P8C59_004134 [Phyllachora maydis]|uniref:Uncharacterized protein n=1 Tax=Phyllachora maydis TaxID=1825666 RepID=A0AAD9MC52_9PEZI|nr:hypothetical protein P8C59_004134 [Phyllachora maydis]
MFSPAVYQDGPARGTRSSRRRQRPASSESLAQQPKAKRQRVPLSETTFLNPETAPETLEVKSDRPDLLGITRDGTESFGAPKKELSVRSKKAKAGERISKSDGSTTLTTNSAYTVTRLPALPDRARSDAQNRQHGAVYSSNGYALTLTHTHALVWNYTASNPTPETFVFTLSYPSKHATDPLPLGALVAPSAASEEPGLVVVMPISGKVVYWESISSAATLEFIREQRTGVEESIHGMFSGEHVIQIVNVESVGFVLVFSSGRLAYMNVRDSHGRPSISTQFFRNTPNSAAGGFFGSLVAFIVYNRSVVITSLVARPDSPEAQLQEDSHIVSSTYEDVIDLGRTEDVQIIGSGFEEPVTSGQEEVKGHRHRTKNPATTIVVQGVGILRVAINEVDQFIGENPPKVTAKSKLEQAVMYGLRPGNPLVFEGRRKLAFSDHDLGNAAIEMSNEIVMSKSVAISNAPASIESNMETRLEYIDGLIAHLNVIGVQLNERARWMLLYNAEKLHVAYWVWKKNEMFVSQRPKGDTKNLVAETVICIDEEQKTEPRPDVGEVDPVRHWFINDVWRIEIFVAWAYQIIKLAYKERSTDEAGLNRLLWEAVIIMNGALSTAREYRIAKHQLYGLDTADNAGGEAVPEPWTCSRYIVNNLKRLIEFCHKWLELYHNNGNTPVDPVLLEETRKLLPSLTSQWFELLQEFCLWSKTNNDREVKTFAETCDKAYREDTVPKILILKDFDLWEDAIRLAIRFRSWAALAQLLVARISECQDGASSGDVSTSEAQELMRTGHRTEKQMGELIDEHGSDFANHAFSELLDRCGIQTVLDFPFGRRQYKTGFLRTKPELAKISWINDVQGENDVEKAAETLVDLGVSREQQVWNKKIELSLGKLALLARQEDQPSSRTELTKSKENIVKVDRELRIIKIQDSLYKQILPTIQAAVDESAELELAVKEHSSPALRKQKALFRIFEDAMARLLKHEALNPMTLIDLLTLVTLDPSHIDIIGDQFYLALLVADLRLDGEACMDAQRLIWRRCYIRDDWKAVNETNLKLDQDQLHQVGETAVYRALFWVVNQSANEQGFWPVLKPTECLGVFVDKLDSRFDSLDDVHRNRILDAMKWEDTRLQIFIAKCRLEDWQGTCLYEAKKTVEWALEEEEATQVKAAPPLFRQAAKWAGSGR